MIKTKGIIISQLKYRETSLIVKIFTETLGIKSYILNSVRTSKPKYNPALFQPLNIVDIVAYNKTTNSLNYINEIRPHCMLHHILTDPYKGFISIFISELINKTLREGETHENTFCFLFIQINMLNDSRTKNPSLFLIKFLVQFCQYLGFGIENANQINNQLIKNQSHKKLSIYEKELINNIISIKDINGIVDINITNIIGKLLSYYELHISSVKDLKSYEVLKIMMTLE